MRTGKKPVNFLQGTIHGKAKSANPALIGVEEFILLFRGHNCKGMIMPRAH